MKAIDEVGGWSTGVYSGGGGERGCGSEMVFKWAEQVQFRRNEGFVYCRVNKLMVRSSIEASCN